MVKHWKLKHETKNVHPWKISFPQWISLERMLYPTILSKDCIPWLNMTCWFLKCIFCVLGTYTLMTQKLIWMFLYKKITCDQNLNDTVIFLVTCIFTCTFMSSTGICFAYVLLVSMSCFRGSASLTMYSIQILISPSL